MDLGHVLLLLGLMILRYMSHCERLHFLFWIVFYQLDPLLLAQI